MQCANQQNKAKFKFVVVYFYRPLISLGTKRSSKMNGIQHFTTSTRPSYSGQSTHDCRMGKKKKKLINKKKNGKEKSYDSVDPLLVYPQPFR